MTHHVYPKGHLEYSYGWSPAKTPEFKQNREFETGATRDGDTDKFDYEGFLSPLVLEGFAEYMHRARHTEQGLRDSDNWQKGIPLNVYMKSLIRHLVAAWKKHRGHSSADIKDDLYAMLFNIQGYLHETLKEELYND